MTIRPKVTTAGAYTYSYAMNDYFESNKVRSPLGQNIAHIGNIINVTEKIILAEEDDRTINDGLFNAAAEAQPNFPARNASDMLAIRHDRMRTDPDPLGLPVIGSANADRKGNAIFVDGHGEFVTRQYFHDMAHLHPYYGN